MAFGYIDSQTDGWARRLLRRMLGWPHLVRRLQAPFVMEELGVSPGEIVVDIGAGGGHYCMELSRRGALAVAVEIRLDSLAALQSSTRFGPTLAACVCDARRLPFRAGSVHKILLSGTLQSTDAADVLHECARVLKPGGALVACALARHPLIGALYCGKSGVGGAVLRKMAGLPGTYEEFREDYRRRHLISQYLQPSDLQRLAAPAGLSLERMQYAPSGWAALGVDAINLLGWRRGRTRRGRVQFLFLYPVLALLQRITPARDGGEWVGRFILARPE